MARPVTFETSAHAPSAPAQQSHELTAVPEQSLLVRLPLVPLAIARNGASAYFDPRGGLAVLGLDWLLFGTNLFSSLLATPVLMAIGFVLATLIVYPLQRGAQGHGRLRALVESLIAGVFVSIPSPLGGTALGALMLAASGLRLTSPHSASAK